MNPLLTHTTQLSLIQTWHGGGGVAVGCMFKWCSKVQFRWDKAEGELCGRRATVRFGPVTRATPSSAPTL